MQPGMWAVPTPAAGMPLWSPFAGQPSVYPPQLCAPLQFSTPTDTRVQPQQLQEPQPHPQQLGDLQVSGGVPTDGQSRLQPEQGMHPLQPQLCDPSAAATPQPQLCDIIQIAAGVLGRPLTTQLSSSCTPLPPQQQQQQHLQQPSTQHHQHQHHQQQQHHHQQQQQQQQQDLHHDHADVMATATVTVTTSTRSPHGKLSSSKAPDDSLLSELEAQLQLRQDAAAQNPTNWLAPPPQQQQQQPCVPLQDLQLLLPAVHAEYKAEMRLMLRACQVASNVTKHSTATGTTLLLDPASREQLQRQVLANCNEKHAVVMAAFKEAAQAVEIAAAAAGCSGFTQLQQDATTDPAAQPSAGGGSYAAAVTRGSMSLVWQALQQLRASYQQELVAATSALFAICRGFGQRYALTTAASASIKVALAAAQQQHGRVEQLWQDVVLAAGGA